jgi:hypothetical protein
MLIISRLSVILAVIAGMAVSSISFSGAALAAGPARTGTFKTWPAAQKAAGFKLLKPTSTFGLRRQGGINVMRCQSPTKLDVNVSYAHAKANMFWDQTTAKFRCGDIGEATFLGRYRVDGVWARLLGACGVMSAPPCSSRKLYPLDLLWAKHGVSYLLISEGVRRATIVGFARGLRPVR